MMSQLPEHCRIWNQYGPAETTLDATYHLVDGISGRTGIRIVVPLPNYQCLVFDEFLQHVFVGQMGELLVGGVGVFVGYLGRDDLTANALVEIDDQVFYRTGDLVQLDSDGLLYYTGRKDHQIKLRGQRIELGEIERCLLDASISVCVVIKWGDEHLIAYVEGWDIDEERLREHCRSRLPPFMVPSMFIWLQNVPLNANGKLDRKPLPLPDFSSLTTTSSRATIDMPRNKMEEEVHNLWC